jgi:hypothetical protein
VGGKPGGRRRSDSRFSAPRIIAVDHWPLLVDLDPTEDVARVSEDYARSGFDDRSPQLCVSSTDRFLDLQIELMSAQVNLNRTFGH